MSIPLPTECELMRIATLSRRADFASAVRAGTLMTLRAFLAHVRDPDECLRSLMC
jgi:hypothetical protein